MRLADLVKLMKQQWPFPTGRTAVVGGYASIGAQHPHVLADIALRNYVFSDMPAGSERELSIAEGRRRCALEIMSLCNVGYAELWQLLERKPKTKEGRA